MKVNIHKLFGADIPTQLRQLYLPPRVIYYTGCNPRRWLDKPKLGIVGSRKATAYGRAVTDKLAGEMAQSGVVIVSGLAFGIDSISHQAALDVGGQTVAVLPGPIEQIYPASHRQLAERIIQTGGSLISEYPQSTDIRKENFIARNRIIAGLSDALLVPQAANHSGSLHTVNFALEQGKTVMAVPGEINLEMSAGSNNLLKSGAILVTSSADIFSAMKLKPNNSSVRKPYKATPVQEELFKLIKQGISDTEDLALASKMPSDQLNAALGLLEIEGYIQVNAGHWTVS